MNPYKKPYLWRDPKGFPNAAWLDYRWKERKTDSLTFMMGHSLPFASDRPGFEFTLEDPKNYDLVFHSEQLPEKWLKYDCLPNNMGGDPPIVNKRAFELFNIFCPDDFQSFPVIIRNENPKLPDFENHDYSLLNLTHLVDAIDQEESLIIKSSEVPDIRKLRLKENCMGDRHIARLANFKPEIIVSHQLISLFKKEKITGVRFLKDYEAYPYTPPEIHLYNLFQEDKEPAKRYFVSLLNNSDDYTIFKSGLKNIPAEVIEELIEMTLSRSSFHAEQCAELRELLKQS